MPRSPRAFIHRYRFELFAAAAFAGYLLFPSTLNGATLVYQRFLAPAYVIAAIAAAPRKDAGMGPVPRALATLIPILTLAALWPVLQDASDVRGELDGLFPRVQLGSSVALVDMDPIDASRVYGPWGASARVLAVRGGRVMPSFAESPNAPVMIDPAVRWEEPSVRLTLGSRGFVPAHDLRRFRYALLHTKYDGTAALAAAALAPEGKLLATSGEWMLFESTLEVAPVVSPDVPMETPTPSTLDQRMRTIAAKWTASHSH
jgi:hypothetical protein